MLIVTFFFRLSDSRDETEANCPQQLNFTDTRSSFRSKRTEAHKHNDLRHRVEPKKAATFNDIIASTHSKVTTASTPELIVPVRFPLILANLSCKKYFILDHIQNMNVHSYFIAKKKNKQTVFQDLLLHTWDIK